MTTKNPQTNIDGTMKLQLDELIMDYTKSCKSHQTERNNWKQELSKITEENSSKQNLLNKLEVKCTSLTLLEESLLKTKQELSEKEILLEQERNKFAKLQINYGDRNDDTFMFLQEENKLLRQEQIKMKDQIKSRDKTINEQKIQNFQNEQKIRELETSNTKYQKDYEQMKSTSEKYSNTVEDLENSKIVLYNICSSFYKNSEINVPSNINDPISEHERSNENMFEHENSWKKMKKVSFSHQFEEMETIENQFAESPQICASQQLSEMQNKTTDSDEMDSLIKELEESERKFPEPDEPLKVDEKVYEPTFTPFDDSHLSTEGSSLSEMILEREDIDNVKKIIVKTSNHEKNGHHYSTLTYSEKTETGPRGESLFSQRTTHGFSEDSFNDLKAENLEMKRKILYLESEIQNIIQNNNAKKTEEEDWEDNKHFKAVIKRKELLNESLVTRIQLMDKKISKSDENDLKILQEKNNRLNELTNTMKAYEITMKNKLEEQKRQSLVTQTNLEQLNEELMTLNAEYDQLKAKEKTNIGQLNEAYANIEGLTNKIYLTEKEFEFLKYEFADLKYELSELNGEKESQIDNLKFEISHLNKNYKSETRKQDELMKVSKESDQNKKLQNTLNTLSAELNSLKKSHTSTVKDFERELEEKDSQIEKLAALEPLVTDLKKEREELNLNCDYFNGELNGLIKSHGAMKEELLALKNELKSKNDEIYTWYQKSGQLDNETDQLASSKDLLQEKLFRVKKEINTNRSEGNKENELAQELLQVSNELDGLKVEFESEHNKWSNYESCLTEKEKKINNLKDELNTTIINANKSKERDKEKLENEKDTNQKLKTYFETLLREFDNLKTSHKSLNSTVENLERELQEKDAKIEKLVALEALVPNFEKERDELNLNCEGFNGQLDGLLKAHVAMKEELLALKYKLKSKNDEIYTLYQKSGQLENETLQLVNSKDLLSHELLRVRKEIDMNSSREKTQENMAVEMDVETKCKADIGDNWILSKPHYQAMWLKDKGSTTVKYLDIISKLENDNQKLALKVENEEKMTNDYKTNVTKLEHELNSLKEFVKRKEREVDNLKELSKKKEKIPERDIFVSRKIHDSSLDIPIAERILLQSSNFLKGTEKKSKPTNSSNISKTSSID